MRSCCSACAARANAPARSVSITVSRCDSSSTSSFRRRNSFASALRMGLSIRWPCIEARCDLACLIASAPTRLADFSRCNSPLRAVTRRSRSPRRLTTRSSSTRAFRRQSLCLFRKSSPATAAIAGSGVARLTLATAAEMIPSSAAECSRTSSNSRCSDATTCSEPSRPCGCVHVKGNLNVPSSAALRTFSSPASLLCISLRGETRVGRESSEAATF
mmetsp:Transcript_15877/g.28188  ORF Transcript_15877/g.28188 Transcript_15877/m.28188 type:complete len:217 (-) Transcript_15877:282-932(-)